MSCLTDIGELANCKGLIDASIDKTTALGIYTRINSKCSSKVDTDDTDRLQLCFVSGLIVNAIFEKRLLLSRVLFTVS